MINRAYFKNKSKVIETENVLHLTYDEEGSVRDFVVSYIPKRELHQHMQRILVNKSFTINNKSNSCQTSFGEKEEPDCKLVCNHCHQKARPLLQLVGDSCNYRSHWFPLCLCKKNRLINPEITQSSLEVKSKQNLENLYLVGFSNCAQCWPPWIKILFNQTSSSRFFFFFNQTNRAPCEP